MRLLPLGLCLALLATHTLAAQMDVLTIPGKTLAGNPLGDPVQRRAAVFSPTDSTPAQPLPLVLYLPGWGGSAEEAIAEGKGGWLGQATEALAARRHPVRIVTVDARSRYGGSQYLNSTATGNYADYVAGEILDAVKAKYTTGTGRLDTLIAGHSSGGYGALILAMQRQQTFGGVVALSPDSDFETTHKPLAQEAEVRAVSPAAVEESMGPKDHFQVPEGLAGLVLGLCANYVPNATKPGRFEWLYDVQGKWRPAVWARWIAHDPLTMVREKADAFAPDQRIYLDGAEHDEFGANIGARQIAEVLRTRSSAVEFYEPAGHHGDHLAERLTRGLLWVLAK